MLWNAILQDISCEVLIRAGRILWRGSWKLGSSLLEKTRKQCTSDLWDHSARKNRTSGLGKNLYSQPTQSQLALLGKGALLKALEVTVAEWWWQIPCLLPPAWGAARCQALYVIQKCETGGGREIESTEGEMQKRQRKDFCILNFRPDGQGWRGNGKAGMHVKQSRFNMLLERVIKNIRVEETVPSLEKGAERRGCSTCGELATLRRERLLEPFGRD